LDLQQRPILPPKRMVLFKTIDTRQTAARMLKQQARKIYCKLSGQTWVGDGIEWFVSTHNRTLFCRLSLIRWAHVNFAQKSSVGFETVCIDVPFPPPLTISELEGGCNKIYLG